jgi:hypothetical protein
MIEERSNVRWILECAVDDGNWREALPKLTDEELRYCLLKEKRKTALTKLKALARKRNKEACRAEF